MSASIQQWPVLGPEERKLLLAALNSNKEPKAAANAQPLPPKATDTVPPVVDPSSLNASAAGFDFDNFTTQNFGGSGDGFDLGFDDSLNDYSEVSPEAEGEVGEKRKNPDDFEDGDEHGDLKRRDSDDKQAKKPGRKPLTSEPTTKRKAQNRAAQRAFRERKEKHLKDLEQKVLDLEKASESANHENGLLRAQVDRLSEELKAYRRRVSSGAAAGPSPPRTAISNQSTFDFDFPKFGSVPETWFPSPKSASAATGTSPAGLSNQGVSPKSATSGSTQQQTPSSYAPDSFNSLFADGGFFDASAKSASTSTASPDPIFDLSNLKSGQTPNYSQSRAMSQSNTSDSNSPSISSLSHKDQSSSYCTSPESSTQSPNMQKDKEPQSRTVYRNGFITEVPASGNSGASNNDSNKVNGAVNTNGSNDNSNSNANFDFGLDWFASQNGGSFDPVLFGDYRDPQTAVVGDGDFTGGFFEDSLPFPDYNDPFNFNMSTSTTVPAPVQAKPSLMEQVAASREGDDEEDAKKLQERCQMSQEPDNDKRAMMTAHKIWNSLQNCPKFVSGDLDIDSLCTELSAKAKCTESGVAVPKKDVEAALWRLVGVDAATARQRLGSSDLVCNGSH